MTDPTTPSSSGVPRQNGESSFSGAGGIPPNRFAVPESPEARRASMAGKIIVPEAADESEERLIRRRETGDKTASGKRDRSEFWFALLLFLASSFAVLLSGANIGMAWDEAYYVEAGQKTKVWLQMWLGGAEHATSRETLGRFWDAHEDEPRGHPSVTRFLAALGMFLVPEGHPPLAAMRAPTAFCFGLTLALLYALMRRYYGHVTAWLSVLSYLFMPRVFGHAHFALTETPMVLMTVLSVYAFLRGLQGWRWSLLFGAALGLAVATKANALLLPVILLPWAFLFYRRESLNNLYAMLFLSPVVMVAAWPWLWFDTARHFLQYLDWNFVQNRQLGLWYNGILYPSALHPHVPGDYAPRLLALTLPLSVLVLSVLGVARTVRAPRKHFVGLLFLWAAAVPCLVLALPSSPKYDGVRLFLPAFPFVASLAGIGGGVLVRIAAFYDRPGGPGSSAKGMLTALVLILSLEGGWALLSSRPFYLSYFNPLVGGRRGAAGKLEVTYWGEALNRAALRRINELVPDGATLTPRGLNNAALRYCQQWGWLKPEIRLLEDRPAEYHLLQYRRGFWGLPDEMLFHEYEQDRIAVFPERGVPLLGLYRTSPEFLEELGRRMGRP